MSIASLRFYVIKLCNRALPQSVYGLVVVLGGDGCEVCEGDLESFVGFLCVVAGGCWVCLVVLVVGVWWSGGGFGAG